MNRQVDHPLPGNALGFPGTPLKVQTVGKLPPMARLRFVAESAAFHPAGDTGVGPGLGAERIGGKRLA